MYSNVQLDPYLAAMCKTEEPSYINSRKQHEDHMNCHITIIIVMTQKGHDPETETQKKVFFGTPFTI